MDTIGFANNQIRYIGQTHRELETYHIESGFWKNQTLRDRHRYVLSPCVYEATERQQTALSRLARATYTAVQKLNAELCRIANSMRISHDDARLLRLANNASRGLLRPKHGETKIPPVIKVDLVQDIQGNYSIVEIDAYNPRGFGFAALLEGSLPPGFRRFPGMKGLAAVLRESGVSESAPWYIFVSEFERYYETPFRIFERAMSERGVPLEILRELQVAASSYCSFDGRGLLVIPESLDAFPAIRDELLRKYQDGSLKTFYPPVAYLGSKAFLPFLRACEGMEEFIPPTMLVDTRHHGEDFCSEAHAPLVLKGTVSSGLKKVFFSDLDGAVFAETLTQARGIKNACWILQEQVPQQSLPVLVFNSAEDLTVQNHFLRITAYISEYGVIDAQITGRPDRKVHGAPDCIMLPVVLSC